MSKPKSAVKAATNWRKKAGRYGPEYVRRCPCCREVIAKVWRGLDGWVWTVSLTPKHSGSGSSLEDCKQSADDALRWATLKM